jgi:hypothetical protein
VGVERLRRLSVVVSALLLGLAGLTLPWIFTTAIPRYNGALLVSLGGTPDIDLELLGSWERSIAVGALLLALVTLAGWLLWQYQAHACLLELAAPAPVIRPERAILVWLLPVVNLFAPVHDIRKLWRASRLTQGPHETRLIDVVWPAFVGAVVLAVTRIALTASGTSLDFMIDFLLSGVLGGLLWIAAMGAWLVVMYVYAGIHCRYSMVSPATRAVESPRARDAMVWAFGLLSSALVTFAFDVGQRNNAVALQVFPLVLAGWGVVLIVAHRRWSSPEAAGLALNLGVTYLIAGGTSFATAGRPPFDSLLLIAQYIAGVALMLWVGFVSGFDWMCTWAHTPTSTLLRFPRR